jgi:hypothetical protein
MAAPAQGCPDLISPSVLLAVLQTLFAALLSFGAVGQPSLAHGSQGQVIRESAAISFSLSERATAVKEDGDRSDPHLSGGNALPPTAPARVEAPAPSHPSSVPLAALGLAERSARAHPATGPPQA